jgi:hypothetical protein
MNRNLDSHSPAAPARLRTGQRSSMPPGDEISNFTDFAVPHVAPQGVPLAVPI